VIQFTLIFAITVKLSVARDGNCHVDSRWYFNLCFFRCEYFT